MILLRFQHQASSIIPLSFAQILRLDFPYVLPYTTLISPPDLNARLADSNWVVIDCRFSLGEADYGKHGYAESHIPGACYADLDKDLSGPIVPGTTGRHPLPELSAFVDCLNRWGIGNDSQVVAYDDMGGPFAARLWWMLRWLGHEAVAVLDGGWPAWLKSGFPTNSTPCQPAQTDFTPHLQKALLASAEEVLDAINRPETTLVDARAEERFAGRNEPLDPVAGHIPSAVCFPWTGNLDEEKKFLPVSALRDRFAAFSDTPQLISYCGSGVTGAHNALAITHAGYPIPRLYAGSWSEWITDPSRPIATE